MNEPLSAASYSIGMEPSLYFLLKIESNVSRGGSCLFYDCSHSAAVPRMCFCKLSLQYTCLTSMLVFVAHNFISGSMKT